MTHSILKGPQTLIESIMRREPLTSLTPPELNTDDLLGSDQSAIWPANSQIIAQRRIKVELYLTPADIVVRFLRTVKNTSCDGIIFGTRIHCR